MKSLVQFESMACYLCGERLTDPESIKRGTGPVCADKMKRFMVFAGSSVEEIASLALADDPTVARWLRLVARALVAGRLDQADRFLNAARSAATAARTEAEIDSPAAQAPGLGAGLGETGSTLAGARRHDRTEESRPGFLQILQT